MPVKGRDPSLADSIAADNDTRFKSDLSFFKGRSLAYFESIQQRFKTQKEKNPERPYGFLVPEMQSTVDYMIAELKLRIQLYGGENGLFWRLRARAGRTIYTVLGMKGKLEKQRQSLEAELELLNLELKDLTAISEAGPPPYDLLVEHSFWFTRAMQLTEHNKRAPFRMYPYEMYMKSSYGAAIEELNNYKQGQMDFFAKHFTVNGSKIFSPDLEVFVLPLVGPLLPIDFIELRNVPIYMASVTSHFLRADGFVLNPHTLFLHDLYFHGSMIFENDIKYFTQKKMDEEQIRAFRAVQQGWIKEFSDAVDEIPDKNLRNAVVAATLTITHDRGRPFAPSTFLGHDARNYYFVMKGELYVAAFGQLNKRVGSSITEVLSKMDDALEFINKFWSKYSDSPY